MTTLKNKALLGAIACAVTFGLAGCDSIAALPANYESPVVLNEDGAKTDVYDNLMGVLYDAITGGKTDKVLNEFIKIVANDQFGSFKDLKAAVESGNKETVKEFVSKHKGVYVSKNDEVLAEKFATTVDEIQYKRVCGFYEQILKRINKAFYGEIESGSYSKDSKFYEIRLAYAHAAELFDIKDLDNPAAEWYAGYLTPDFRKDDVTAFIHFDRYEDYIERRIVPEIYKELLVEQYLMDEKYSTLGRAYGREVNIIKLTRDDKFKSVPSTMMNKFVDDKILNTTSSDVDFEFLANVWRGFDNMKSSGEIVPLTSEEKAFLVNCGYTAKSFTQYVEDGTNVTFDYFSETQLGMILDEYNLIVENSRYVSEEASAAQSKFTNSNSYPKEIGLRLELAKLALADYTTDGWYVKNGGLSELPEDIRNRLFNISVSSDIDHFEAEEMETQNKHEYDSSKFVRYINNNYYLTPAKSESSSENPRNFVIFENGNYYLVQIKEAVSSSKLDVDGDNGYTSIRKADGEMFTESCAREIANQLGTKESYANNAYSKYIKEYSITYHDSSIYDYFKSKFPELFEENK